MKYRFLDKNIGNFVLGIIYFQNYFHSILNLKEKTGIGIGIQNRSRYFNFFFYQGLITF